MKHTPPNRIVKNLFGILLALSFIGENTFAQYCPTNTITTYPDNYQNSTDPNQLLKWDWRLQTFTGYRPGVPTRFSYQITNPFLIQLVILI